MPKVLSDADHLGAEFRAIDSIAEHVHLETALSHVPHGRVQYAVDVAGFHVVVIDKRFDEGTIQRLRRLWIAVIGASGTGSPVVEQLLRLGVGVLAPAGARR
jgi:hypothetical protein